MVLPHSFRPITGTGRSKVCIAFEHVASRSRGDRAAVQRALTRLGLPAASWTLYHTEWGQPRLRRSAGAPRLPARPAVSFADEGDMRLVAVAHAAGLVGLGIDVLDLRRMRRYAGDPRAMRRLQQRICSAVEIMTPELDDGWSSWESLAVRFGVKEAASKALGTGLRLGLGIGARSGVPMTSIEVHLRDQRIVLDVTGVARRRAHRLGADWFETHVGRSAHVQLAVVLAWR